MKKRSSSRKRSEWVAVSDAVKRTADTLNAVVLVTIAISGVET